MTLGSSPIALNTIYNEDCLDTMKRMSDQSIDLVITSPPYNMRTRVRDGKYTEREKSAHFSKKYHHFDDALSIEEYYEFHRKCITEMLRVAPLVFWNIQIVTGSKEALFRLMGHFHKEIKDIIIWDKGGGQPAMHPAVINRGYELIIIFEQNASAGRAFKKYYFNRGEMSDVWSMGRGGGGETDGHGAVFPLKLVKKILINWSKQGDTVYDPFMGTGTTARAAMDLGRNYIGSEISSHYCNIAEQRLGQTVLL